MKSDNRLSQLENKTEQRHEENEKRFDSLQNKITEISAELKILIALVLINGGLSILHNYLTGK